ncbi:MAG: tyrosine-type recombinase/integrase [Clostridia bacterium]|nr:tyrosine-type recombinase/integrase [Clostridia bacterium]
MHPNTPYTYLQKLLKKYNLPKVSLHSFRHTNATIMINSGTDIRTVSGRLGHSQTSTTLNIYAHLIQKADRAAADIVSDALLKKPPISKEA